METIRVVLPETIRTNRLVLTRLKYEDADEIFHTYASKPEATQYMAWPTHQSVRDTRDFLEYVVNAWDIGTDFSFSIRLPGTHRLVGSFGIMHDHGKVQFGYIISPVMWGNGYATEVCVEMMRRLRSVTSLYRIGTFVDAENVSSAKVLIKAGLIEEVRLPNWIRFVNQGNRPKDCILFRLP